MNYKSRRIFKTVNTSQSEIRELLQFMFVGEILSPSQKIWLVTPWISNVPILDNRTGTFGVLDPSWGHREIRLTEILLRIMALGTQIVIVTRPDEHCLNYTSRLFEQSEEMGVKDKLLVLYQKVLHTKGVLTDNGLLTGSMNLTNNGLDLLDEMVTFDTDIADIAQARINFEGYLNETT